MDHESDLPGHELDQPTANAYEHLEHPEIVARRAVEARKLNAILGRASDVFPDGYDLIPVGEEGFIVRNRTYPVETDSDWVTFDLDDTLINYSAAKRDRSEAYAVYLRDRGIEFDQSIQDGVLEVSDRFARWTEPGGSSVTYHLSAHIQSADWLTAQLAKIPPDQQQVALADLEEHLNQVKAGEGTGSDPFHFQDGRLITRHRVGSDRSMEAVFSQAIAGGAPFDDTVEAMEQLSQIDPRPNIAVFTRGTPDFQLAKQIELMRARDIPVSEIWLTKETKGEFFHTMADEGHAAFSGPDNAVVHLDDRATDVASILMSRESGTIGSAMVDVIHLWRPDSAESGALLAGGRSDGEPNLTHNADSEGTDVLVDKLVTALRDRLWAILQSGADPGVRPALIARYSAYERYLAHS
jgi:FMN phosphatase YigB (HAD superfamily)